jgi:hypothetical protein
MSQQREQNNLYHEQAGYELEREDKLGVLTSTREVVWRARLVRIDHERVQQLADQLLTSESHAPELSGSTLTLPTPAWPTHYHFFDGTQRTVNWMLLLDALNFCFWSEKGQPRWQIQYRQEILDGYWAEAASLRRAMEEQLPVGDAEYLSNIGRQELATIFRGLAPDGPLIPLLAERLSATREVGQVLLERFEGQFSHLVEQMHGSGVELALALARHFSSFRDVATYENLDVYFLKRAQICVSDLVSAFQGEKWGAFTDLDQLTVFADYKLPQVLRHSGALVYAPELAARVDAQELLAPGSAAEVEIRASTIWASELLRRAVGERLEQPVTAAAIDQLLWHLGQDAAHMRPYHRVRTIYY